MKNAGLEQELKLWYQGPLGASLLSVENKRFEKALKQAQGNYALKFNLANEELLSNCHALHCIYVSQNLSKAPKNEVFSKEKSLIKCDFTELPFLSESIDVVVMPHVLEFSNDPLLILEEVFYALAPQGKLIISCFNPSSLWNIVKYFKYKNANLLPWSAKFIGQRKLKNWLTEFGFSIDSCSTFYFRPPINNKRVIKSLALMEKSCSILFPKLGACYMMVATKTIRALPPLEPVKLTQKAVSNINC